MNVTVISTSYFGGGDGPIFKSEVACQGHEDRLIDCPNSGLEVHSCNHNQDIGILCMPGKYPRELIFFVYITAKLPWQPN